MNLNITTTEAKTRNHSVSAIATAALIAGREVHDLDEALTAELAYEAAETFFAEAGVTSRETYLAHRAAVKSGLRQTAAEIRDLKASLRQMDGNSQGFWQAQSELGQAVIGCGCGSCDSSSLMPATIACQSSLSASAA